MDLRQRLLEVLEPYLAEDLVELVDVRVQSHSRRRTVCLLVDQPGGVTINDCARISRHVEDYLDTQDVIPFRYVLEVSSPGFDRPLRTRQHFERFVGEQVEIQMDRSFGERRQYTGELTGVADGVVSLRLGDGDEVRLPLDEIRSARVRIDPWKPRGGTG